MKRALFVAATLLGALGAPPARADEPPADQPPAPADLPPPADDASLPELGMDRAVAIALQRNRDVIAAKLEIRAAELDKVAASLYPNPILSLGVGNLVMGAGNPQNQAPARPGVFGQPVYSVGVSEVIDVWAKRSARMHAADEGIRYRRLVVEDALREIVYSVRSAFADVVREQSERDLARTIRDRYAETVRLSRSRFKAGEISDAEFRKIELEGLKYDNDVVDAEQEYDVARQRLAALLGLGTDLPFRASFPVPRDTSTSVAKWTEDALAHRPDILAARAARRFADASISSERREAYPDISLGVSYTHSEFLASGDNPNTFGVSLAMPLPVFDRNQAGIGRAELEAQRAQNDEARLKLAVRRDVASAARRLQRARSLLGIYEAGGMIDRADKALSVAENSYKAGAISLLELLEARRTYVETRGGYLRAQHDLRQSYVDLIHAVGRNPP